MSVFGSGWLLLGWLLCLSEFLFVSVFGSGWLFGLWCLLRLLSRFVSGFVLLFAWSSRWLCSSMWLCNSSNSSIRYRGGLRGLLARLSRPCMLLL